jgi:hypothetical protein
MDTGLELREDIEIAHIDGSLWTPVRLKPKREKKVLEYCDKKGLTCYLPLMRKLHRYKGRRKTVEFYVPMFNGYIFANLNEESYRELVKSNSILYRIGMLPEQEDELINELNSLRIYEEISKEQEVIVKPELVKGKTVIVDNGAAFRGVQGVIVKRRGKTLVYVNIELLGQSVSAVVDAADLFIDD